MYSNMVFPRLQRPSKECLTSSLKFLFFFMRRKLFGFPGRLNDLEYILNTAIPVRPKPRGASKSFACRAPVAEARTSWERGNIRLAEVGQKKLIGQKRPISVWGCLLSSPARSLLTLPLVPLRVSSNMELWSLTGWIVLSTFLLVALGVVLSQAPAGFWRRWKTNRNLASNAPSEGGLVQAIKSLEEVKGDLA